MALISGYFLGWEGFAGTVAAYALAAATGYRLARLIDHGALRRFLHLFPKAEAIIKELAADTLQLIVLVRLSPVLPFALMTFVLASVGVNFQRFIVGSVLGMLPRTLFFYWLGTRAAGLSELLAHPERTSIGQWAGGAAGPSVGRRAVRAYQPRRQAGATAEDVTQKLQGCGCAVARLCPTFAPRNAGTPRFPPQNSKNWLCSSTG